MKGWCLIKPNKITEKEIIESCNDNFNVKVKITKALVNVNDVLRFNGEIEVPENRVLGSYGIGQIAEIKNESDGLKKGDKVFVESSIPCNSCYNCNNNKEDSCIAPLIAGEDFDGFLRDFVSVSIDKVHLLPDSVNDIDALFINYVSSAVNIIDSLSIEKGEYVAIVGADNFSMILAQLLLYYQAVPIVITENEKSKQLALKNGVYYVLTPEDSIAREVSTITGGRMADKVVYSCDTSISVNRAFSIASFGATIAYSGFSTSIASFSFNQAIRKQLKIFCINNTSKNTPTSINLLVNKAINTELLSLENIKYKDVKTLFDKYASQSEDEEKIYEAVIDMI